MLEIQYVKACEDMIRTHSSSFYNAFRFLPSPRREAVYVIYAFCRLIDDAVDEPERSPFTIEELEAQFWDLESADGHFIWPSLRWLFRQFPIEKDPFFHQMQGQRRDLVQTHYDTMDELSVYCYQVAGTVGEMLVAVLHDNPDEKVREAGILLGKAMQIVNIVRDVGEDLRRGRRYIPKTLMAKHQYSEEQFQNQVVNEAFRKMIMELKIIADHWFHEGHAALHSYPRSSRFCIELASRYYRAILNEVTETNDFQVFTKRAYVNDRKKELLFAYVKERFSSLTDEKEGTVSL